MFRTDACWRDLPDEYFSPSIGWRQLQMWGAQDIWLVIWRTFLSPLDQRKQLDWREALTPAQWESTWKPPRRRKRR